MIWPMVARRIMARASTRSAMLCHGEDVSGAMVFRRVMASS